MLIHRKEGLEPENREAGCFPRMHDKMKIIQKTEGKMAEDNFRIEIDKLIAARIRSIRRRRKISQKRLSEKSGVSLGSVKRFESSGEISLISLTKIAIALDIENELEGLFEHVPFLSIEELINEEAEREKKLNAL